MQVLYYGDKIPESFTKSLFLAGPSLRPNDTGASWRLEALEILENQGYDGIVFCPENRNGVFDENFNYVENVEWEENGLNIADVIVFWVPRKVDSLPGFTTNVEWGAWCDSGKVVLGYPENADKIAYLKYYAEKYNVSISSSLKETLENALSILKEGSLRENGERYIPLFIWNNESFQFWYSNQKNAGNRLESARILYTFRPQYKDFVFLWVIKVNLWVESEQRYKDNEFVISRTDISSVVLYFRPEDTKSILDYSIVLIKEFRSPARTKDCFIRELPGGSSKSSKNIEDTAAEEVHEETNFYIKPDRLEFVAAKQLAGTLSSHKNNLFKAELSFEEMEWFRSQEGIVHGNSEDSERTFVEVYLVKDIITTDLVDWSTIGQITTALLQ